MKKIILVSFLFLSVFLISAQVTLAADDCGSATGTDGFSCMDTSEGTACLSGHCPGASNIQCCKPKGASTGNITKSGGSGIPNPLKATSIEELVAQIINYTLGLVGTIALLLFVYGGLIWMTSAGSSDKVKKGRDILVWAVIGMAVVFMSYIAVKFVIQGLQGTLK